MNSKKSSVMIETVEALDAWWPPTLTPEGLGRTRFATWTMFVASQSTRRWISSRAASFSAVAEEGGSRSPE